MLRRLVVGIATAAAVSISLYPANVLAHYRHRGGWYAGRTYAPGVVWGAPWVGSPYYGSPYFGSPYAYPQFFPGYIPENLTYCDPNSGTYIGEDGGRHLC